MSTTEPHFTVAVYYKDSKYGPIQEKKLDWQDLYGAFPTWENVNLKLVTHGFTSNGKSVSVIKDAWLAAQLGISTRVIILDWPELALPWYDIWSYFSPMPLYKKAAENALDVGKTLGKCLARLLGKRLDPKRIHLVGHSLGAHLVGKAGREFTEETNLFLTAKKVGRVTGLDPAGPGWVGDLLDTELANDKLSKESAVFVDVIHTNGDESGQSFRNLGSHLGALQPLGHIDFYVDGGRNQKICDDCMFRQTQAMCSHSQAVQLFHQSIEHPWKFLGMRCSDYGDCTSGSEQDTEYMGEGVGKYGRGTFFIEGPLI